MAKGRLRTYRFIVPVFAILLALPLIPESAPATNGGITPLTTSLPAARSGQTYFWTLRAEGGVKPYRCTYLKLHIGTLALNTLCQITGRAPVVSSESVTGPFIFKLHDSSKRRKTIEFSPMNFTVRAKAPTPTTTSTTTTSTTSTTTTSTTTTIPVPSIVGTWTAADGRQINIETSGSGFVGIEVAAYPSGPCTHPAGQQVWQINAQSSDGSYSGVDQGVTYTIGGDASTCVVTPYSTTWTITGPVGGELQLTADFYSIGETSTFTRPVNG